MNDVESGAPSPSRNVEFEIDDLTIRGQEWGFPGGLPVLALHGWLDNSASFDVLAPLLKDVHLIALDSAGHGLSDHRSRGSAYHIWQDVGEAFEVADQMGWDRFALLGHSRGAIISMLAAGTFPERISHLALLDGIFPSTVPPEQAPQQLARSIIDTKRNRHRGFAIYPDVETAIMVRQRGELPVSEAAARLLIRRGLVELPEGGYTWRSDPQLKVASGFKFCDEQVDAFMQRITARVQLAVAEETLPRFNERFEQAMARYPQIQVEKLAGGHHLHMDAEPAAKLAPILNGFFQQP